MEGILGGGDFCIVERNVLRDTAGPGIVLRNVKECIVRGNTIFYPDGPGIVCENTKNCKVAENLIIGSRRKVALVGDCKENLVKENF